MTQAIDNLAAHRKSFPALDNKAYFNFGGQGTLPQAALDQILAKYQEVQRIGPFSNAIFSWLENELDQTRATLAQQLNAPKELIALTQNATDGCNIVMWGYEWQPGDHLLLSDGEHSSIVATAQQIARRRKVELTYCPLTNAASEDCANLVIEHLLPSTKLVLLSHVLWNTGQVLPLKEIVKVCRERKVPLLVDGAQSAGVLPLNLVDLNADYYAITGHKWICGPEGTGALYVSEERLSELQPTFCGWRGIGWDESGKPAGWTAGAARFETATSPFPLLSGLRKAIEVHEDFGNAEERYAQIIRKATKLKLGLRKLDGVECHESLQESGLVTFSLTGGSHGKAVSWLEKRRIFLRSIPFPRCLRASVHYFNSDEEIDLLIESVGELIKGSAS